MYLNNVSEILSEYGIDVTQELAETKISLDLGSGLNNLI
jgi:hypothetical protein